MPNLPDPILWAIPGFILLVIAEMIYGRLTGKTRFEPRDTAASLVMGLGNTVSGLVLGGIVVAWFVFVEQFALLDIGWAWYWFVIAFVLDDFVYYWSHRWAHTVRWWWADHVVHHSSQHYNLSTALRQPWLNPLTLKFIFLGSWLVLIGFPPAMIAFVAAFNLIYQFWIHTEAIKRLPAPIEWLMNTPSHHRSITPPIRAISTGTMPASSSSGIVCSARSSRRPTRKKSAMASFAIWARITRSPSACMNGGGSSRMCARRDPCGTLWAIGWARRLVARWQPGHLRHAQGALDGRAGPDAAPQARCATARGGGIAPCSAAFQNSLLTSA